MKFASTSRLAFALLAAILLAQPAGADEKADRDAAVAAATERAERWVHAMDEHRYAEAWSQQAAVVKEGRTEREWVAEFSGPREALGKTVMRELKAADFSTRVRGAPQGEYVTVVYLTKFTNIPLAAETILLSRENGQWLIGGYSIADAEPTAPRAPDAPSAAPQPKKKD
jgi:uncharacterized protein DUF4019